MKQGWEIKKLGEVCTIVGGSTPKTTVKEFWDNGVYNWITPADLKGEKYYGSTPRKLSEIAIQRNSLTILPVGSVLLSSRAPIGKVAITTEPMYTNQGFKSAICSDEINNEYLYWFLYGSTDYLNSLGTGATFKEISKKNTESIHIPLPSIDEQIRIVDVINAAFAKIDALKENAQKNLENAKTLFQQVLKQELTPKPNWQTKKLGEIALKKLSYGASVPSRNFDGEYRYIRITDIDEDGKLLNDLVSPAVCEEKHILHSGDLLLARTGGTIGKSYLYSPEDGKCIYAGYLIRVIVNQDIVLPEFVFLNTKTDRYWNFIKKSQKTAAQPNINAQQYSSFDIPYPSKDEQEGIVRKIKSIFTKQKQLEKCCQKTIAECDALKQAVLRRAFNGEL